jgi:cell division protease FtsH
LDQKRPEGRSPLLDQSTRMGCGRWGGVLWLLMVLDWGMGQKLQHVALGGRSEQVFLGQEIAQRREYSEATAREVDEEVRAILETAYQRALDTLKGHRSELDEVVDALLKNEEITGERVLRIMGLPENDDNKET